MELHVIRRHKRTLITFFKTRSCLASVLQPPLITVPQPYSTVAATPSIESHRRRNSSAKQRREASCGMSLVAAESRTTVVIVVEANYGATECLSTQRPSASPWACRCPNLIALASSLAQSRVIQNDKTYNCKAASYDCDWLCSAHNRTGHECETRQSTHESGDQPTRSKREE